MFEFHISRHARDLYAFDQSLFTYDGRMIFANFKAARDVAQKINDKNTELKRQSTARASHLNAMGLIDEIYHHLLQSYKQQQNARIFIDALALIQSQLSPEILDETLRNFIYHFPTTTIYQNKITISDYLQGSTAGVPNKAIALEEMLLLWIENNNPAFNPYKDLFSDSDLMKFSAYPNVINALKSFLQEQSSPTEGYESLWDLLLSPIKAAPHSLFAQLEFLVKRFGTILGNLYFRLLSSLDFVKEEEKATFTGPGPTEVPDYKRQPVFGSADDPIGYSQDQYWMPRLILIAKNIYVWLDQLSKKYQRHISHLDEIPDEELKNLADWGFTGIWLIGLWERSTASARIKQLCGNPEAISSAYSLKDYRIADDLGGERAMDHLQEQAWRYGIRVASDMVPNHMAIDSTWVMDHPEWFISSDQSPYPSYSFNGPDLSTKPGVSINIDDHYYDRTDAAVAFKRYDHNNGNTQYIYHGNDGTSMPWNDTAQLNYLRADVREKVIQTIISVAKRFPVIRFDAAMTLTKKHFQRLWFPLPGTGGDIASRVDYSMSADAFDSLMPEEFWRTVVDRVAREVPDTLLLAEAFWLMEGYFVRTLGMHRVYNSAFMHMLRDEENEKYRKLITNTLEYDPQILNRYVNFMNNPDERTAVDQFGKGDKYFGICTLMATLPGLPMFGHGQIEGFTEKYGMEYKRAYWEETPDSYLVDRHQAQIFPVLKLRHIFAGIDNFLLYDFIKQDGGVDENVFAYSNRFDKQAGLIIYNNKYQQTAGTIKISRAFIYQNSKNADQLTTKSLSEGLALSGIPDKFTILKDIGRDPCYYIRKSSEIAENGLFFELEAYSLHAFVEIYEIEDDSFGSYQKLYNSLGSAPVYDLQQAVKFYKTMNVTDALQELVNPGFYHYLLGSGSETDHSKMTTQERFSQLEDKLSRVLEEIRKYKNIHIEQDDLVLSNVVKDVDLLISNNYPQSYKLALADVNRLTADLYNLSSDETNNVVSTILLTGLIFRRIGKLDPESPSTTRSYDWFTEFNTAEYVAKTLESVTNHPSNLFESELVLLAGLIKLQNWFADLPEDVENLAGQLIKPWFDTPELNRYLLVNVYDGIEYFNRERFELLSGWMRLTAEFALSADTEVSEIDKSHRYAKLEALFKSIKSRLEVSDYQVIKLLE